MKYLILLIILASCGYETEKNTDFRVYYEGNNPEEKQLFRQLTADFNKQLGFTVLHWQESKRKGNSPLSTTKDLALENKLGYGEYESTRRFEQNWHGCDRKFVEDLTLEATFDRDYMNNPDVSYEMKQKLFYHEIGHGLKFGHTEGKHDVMYPYLMNNDADLETFFNKVRKFFKYVDNY